MWGIAQLIVALALATAAGVMLDKIDDASGRRPGGFGSNISYHPVYTTMAGVGFLLGVTAPLTFVTAP